MRCGCPECGTYMAHQELSEGCVCPACLYACTVCMGTGEPPASADKLEALLRARDWSQE